MRGLGPYSRQLEKLVAERATNSARSERIQAALDGEPGMKLRSIIPLEDIRAVGAFFTNKDLADRLISSIAKDLAEGMVISDVACGTGNLLTACAYHLPILTGFQETLELWGQYLCGSDIHDEFVRIAKARLALVALERGAESDGENISLKEAFPKITKGDAFAQVEIISKADGQTLNPPFTMTEAPSECTWATGKVSTAALMLESCIVDAKPGTKIVAVLPEVLRTGSHYVRWRREIERLAKIDSVEVVGLFDIWTDIDVFILRITVGDSGAEPTEDWWRSSQSLQLREKSFQDLFAIRVGPVVPHRDPQRGGWYPFITARELPTWKSVNTDKGFPYRRFASTTYAPPFLVIRRTSRPGDKNRAVATLIEGDRAVAVENHLVILKPKDGSTKQCREGMRRLQCTDTDVWLNERIRCRHLTVSSIGEIPWWK